MSWWYDYSTLIGFGTKVLDSPMTAKYISTLTRSELRSGIYSCDIYTPAINYTYTALSADHKLRIDGKNFHL